MAVNDLINLVLIVILSGMSAVMWPRRFPIQVIVIYWLQIVILPFMQDKQIYSSAYVADSLVMALGFTTNDRLGLPVAIVSVLFMAGHTVGYDLFLEDGTPLIYGLCLTALYLVLIQQFYVKGARDAARSFITRFQHSRRDKAHNDVVGRRSRSVSSRIRDQKAHK